MRDHVLGDVARDGEAYALAGRDNGGGNPHHFAPQVDEGAAAVSRIDGGIGLEEVVVRPRADDPPRGADDALRHRVGKSEGVSDGKDPVAHPHLVGITQGDRGKVLRRRRYLDQGKVGLRVPPYHLCLKLPAVHEAHGDLVRPPHHMIVRHDVSCPVDDHAGAEAPLLQLPVRHVSEKLPQVILELALVPVLIPLPEEELKRIAGELHGADRAYVDHRRLHRLHQVRKRGKDARASPAAFLFSQPPGEQKKTAAMKETTNILGTCAMFPGTRTLLGATDLLISK